MKTTTSGIISGLIIIVMATSSMITSGCNTIKKHVDLGDGQVLDVIPVSAVAAGANLAQPGAGKAVNALEGFLAERRDEAKGPFGGLPVATRYTIALKTPASDGQTIIQQEQIEKIYRHRSAIVPDPITDEVSMEPIFAQSTNTAGRWQAILDQIKTIQSNQAEAITGDVDADVIEALTP